MKYVITKMKGTELKIWDKNRFSLKSMTGHCVIIET